MFDLRADREVNSFKKESIIFGCNAVDFSLSGKSNKIITIFFLPKYSLSILHITNTSQVYRANKATALLSP